VGLTAALALRRHGLPATVLEAEPEGRQRPGSRAIFLHGESLGHLETVHPGLGWEVARRGLVWTTKRTFWGEDLVYERTYPPPPPPRPRRTGSPTRPTCRRSTSRPCCSTPARTPGSPSPGARRSPRSRPRPAAWPCGPRPATTGGPPTSSGPTAPGRPCAPQ